MYKVSLVAISLMIFAANAFSGTRYHVSKSGSDSNDGTLWSTAWASVDKVNNTISAGDTVLFGSGTWYDAQITPPTGGTSATRTVYACSTLTGDSWHLTTLSAATEATGWSVHSGNVYRAEWVGSGCWGAGNLSGVLTLSQNDRLLYPSDNLDSVVNTAGRFWHDKAGDILYVRTWGDVNPGSQTMMASCKSPIFLDDEDQDHILFYGLNMKMGKPVVFFLAGADSVYFEHCNLSHSASGAEENACLIMGWNFGCDVESPDLDCWGRYNAFVACSLTNVIANPRSGGSHRGSGAILYQLRETLFDSCVIYDLPGTGIMYKHGYALLHSDSGSVIRYCTFNDMGFAAIDLYKRNYMHEIYGNVIHNADEMGIRIAGDFNGHKIYNNTLYRCNVPIWMWDFDNEPDSPSCEVKYNVGYQVEYEAGKEHAYILEYYNNYPLIDDFVFDSNYWYGGATFSALVNNSGRNWSTWQNTYNQDQNNSYNSDPGLRDPANGDYMPTKIEQWDNPIFYGGRWWYWPGAVQPPGCPPPDAPALLSPPDDATVYEQPLDLDWLDASGADKYRLQVDNDSLFNSLELVAEPASSSYTLNGVRGGTTYHWRVCAFSDTCGWGNWSSVWKFTFPDTLPPAPTNDLSATSGDDIGEISLMWTASGDDGWEGIADSYVIKHATGMITTANWDALPAYDNSPSPVPAGSEQTAVIASLNPGGLYYVAVRTYDEFLNESDLSNVDSAVAQVNIRLGTGDDSNQPTTFAYPNSFRPSETAEVTFANIPHNSNLLLITLSGSVVRRWTGITSGTVTWDGTNESGNPVASSTYLWFVEGTDIKGKLVVKR